MFRRIAVSGIFLLGAMLLSFKAAEYWLNQQVNIPLNITTDIVIEILPGGNLSRVSNQLLQQNIIEKTLPLRVYAKLHDQENILAGEYKLQLGDTTKGLLTKITTGDIVQYQINFLEGTTYQQWTEILSSSEKLIHTNGINFTLIGIDVQHPEGWLFPDTYYFHKGEKDTDILQRAYHRTKNILRLEWEQRAEGLPYKSAYEALIMASIIEKETGKASEREAIAGVFIRRLNKGMRLQTDPTVIYGLGEAYKGNLTRSHLKQRSAYNTYMIKGLPPTPIAMSGRASIHAALHPGKGKSLYFVAKGDGSHQFSDTLQQHQAAVKKYQLRRKTNYRSSPIK